MYHVIIVSLLCTFSLVTWNLLHFAPRSVSLFLSQKLCTLVSIPFLLGGAFTGFMAGYGEPSAEGLIASVVMCHVGLWFLLLHWAGSGTYEGRQIVRRGFAMMGLLTACLLALFYIEDPRLAAIPQLLLLAAGFWAAKDLERFLDRGR
ncbi:MAG TPA: hypothetical protein VNN21_09600 [Dehalococcoidia bacterium]|nr:hypothetical protein [Dehalococcoidia bacterium]